MPGKWGAVRYGTASLRDLQVLVGSESVQKCLPGREPRENRGTRTPVMRVHLSGKRSLYLLLMFGGFQGGCFVRPRPLGMVLGRTKPGLRAF